MFGCVTYRGIRNRPAYKQVGKVAVLCAVYFFAGRMGIALNAQNQYASLIWPPAAIGLCALLIYGIRVWPGIFLGALAVSYSKGVSLPVAAGIAFGNTVESVMGAYLCTFDGNFHNALDRIQDVRRFFMRATLLSTIVCACIGVASMYLGGVFGPSLVRQTWLLWWVGDSLGILALAPVLLVFAEAGRMVNLERLYSRPIEKIALCISVAGINLLIFTNVFGEQFSRNLKGPFIFPFLLWAAIRFGVMGAAFATYVTAGIALWATANNAGPFSAGSVTTELLQLSIFVAIVAVLNLVIGAIVTERERERADLAKSKQELLRAKEEAEAANAAKTAFLANMSHEIRTPLGALLGYAEILGGEMSPEERLSSIDAVKRNGTILSNLINDILDLSKVEAGKLEVEKVEVALEDIVRDLDSFVSLKAAEKGLAAAIDLTENLPTHFQTDPLRLRQILLNVVGNAIKFTDHGSVSICFKLISSHGNFPRLACMVRDTGTGIPSEQAKRIFEPFTQADISTTRKFGGTGLGLILSRRLARALGGELELTESTAGSGSTFTITIDPGKMRKALPLDSEKTQCAPALSALELQKLNHLKVLLVDDNPDNQYLICRLLKKRNIQVETAFDGREGVNKALSGHFDLILMDVQMPIMDGYEATARLRRQGYSKPIVALTAHAMQEERQRCLAGGFSEHISKPIDSNLLWNVLVNLGGSAAAQA